MGRLDTYESICPLFILVAGWEGGTPDPPLIITGEGGGVGPLPHKSELKFVNCTNLP